MSSKNPEEIMGAIRGRKVKGQVSMPIAGVGLLFDDGSVFDLRLMEYHSPQEAEAFVKGGDDATDKTSDA